MILMTQKKSVTSGTLLSIRRPSERGGGEAMAVMAAQRAGRASPLPDRCAADGRKLEHEAAARPRAGDDVAAASARKSPRERQPEPDPVARLPRAADPGL